MNKMKPTIASDLLPCPSCADSGLTLEGDFCDCAKGNETLDREMRATESEDCCEHADDWACDGSDPWYDNF